MASNDQNHDAGGVRCEVGQTSSVILAPPPTPRQLISVNTNEGVEADGRKGTFTVLSYNVLSDVHVTSERYNYCPPSTLAWTYRSHNLLQEIVAYNADILCLQEVQSNHYEDFFVPELEKHGYTGVYSMKKSPTMFTASGHVNDGCATFYRRDRFSDLGKGKEYVMNFKKYAEAMCGPQPNENVAMRTRLCKGNVALCVVLEAKAPSGKGGQNLLVVNTHICGNPELKDVKLWQVLTLLKKLERMRAINAYIPMLVAGDFNSLPGSAPHCLLSTGGVDPAQVPDLQVDPYNILQPLSKLSHSLPLVSAYASFGRMNGTGPTVEPQFTTCTRDFRGTLDYIFYTANNLTVESLLELLDEDSVRKNIGLPSPEWSSDHIALLAEFRFT